MNVQDLRFSHWFCWIQVFGDVMLWGEWFPSFWSNVRNHPPMPQHYIPQTMKAHTQTWQQTKKISASIGNSTPTIQSKVGTSTSDKPFLWGSEG
jgi:hypothetical protein